MSIAQTQWNRRIRMRDGVEVAANVLLPVGSARSPAVVLRTPYTRSRLLHSPGSWLRLVEKGYALVTVDMRGRSDSQGDWLPWRKDAHDGYDVIEWVAAQPWCSGKVGMVGASYEGLSQWWTAADRPPHLSCIVPMCGGRVQHRLPFSGTGIPSLYRLWWAAVVTGRTQQYLGAPAWEARIGRTPVRNLDASLGLSRSFWKNYVAGEIEPASHGLSKEQYAAIDIPVLVTVGWWDDQESMLVWQALQHAKSAAQCRLLIGAWDHVGNVAPRPTLGGWDVSASVMDTVGYVEQFLALHLKDEHPPLADAPRCRVFVTGEDRWETLDQWPYAEAVPTSMYLTSSGDARGLKGNGRLIDRVASAAGSDTFVYDPNHPGRDMTSLSTFIVSDTPLDHRYLQRRMDALVYTSEPLDEPLRVSGRYRLQAFVASDRPDTDLFVMLSDVHPDGRAIGLAATTIHHCCLRLRYRNGPQAELLAPGQVYEVSVDGSWVHHVFKRGHRVRITLSSGNFPVAARNAASGEHWAGDEVLYPQTNTLHHSASRPSRLVLPVIRRGAH